MLQGASRVEFRLVAAAAERVYGTAPDHDGRGGRDSVACRQHKEPERVASRRPGGSRRLSACGVLALAAALAACGGINNVSNTLLGTGRPAQGQPGYVQGFLGGVAADEPRAALVARDILSAGGTAADAAVALGFTLAVTLPSRAGLGGGGGCLAYAPGSKSANKGVPEAVMFTPLAPASPGANADRPAAVPMLPRGLYLLHARYGRLPFESLIVPAEQLARFGTPTPRALVKDLSLVAGPLFADPNARAVFSHDGTPLVEGQPLVQPALAATLTQIRVEGVGDFYTGGLARRIEQASPLAGGPLSLADLRGALPTLGQPIILPYRNDKVAFVPPPADGGLAAAAAFKVLAADPAALAAAAARALEVAARWREGGVDGQSLLSATSLPEVGLPPLPASTSFVTLDRDGGAVACAISMDNLFGTGRVLPGLGFLLAASPSAVPPPLYAAAIDWNDNIHSFRAAVGGSGQAGAPLAVAAAMLNALRTSRPMASPVPDPGRTNVIECSRYLPGTASTCAWASDPREPGLTAGGG